VQEHGLRTLSAEQERSLDIILRVFEAQLMDAEAGFVTGQLIDIIGSA
jgi:hypothetical protein